MLDAGDGDGPAVPEALIDRAAKVDRPGRELEVLEGAADVAGSNVQEPAGVLVGEGEIAKRVDHHVREGRCFGRQLIEANLPAGVIAVLGVRALRQDHQALAQGRPRNLPEHALLDIDRFEDRAMHEQHLRATEKQIAVVLEGVVEARKDAALGFSGEVHERVPADQEVQTGDGRVLHEVVPAEDQRAPE